MDIDFNLNPQDEKKDAQNVLTVTQVNEFIKYLVDGNKVMSSVYIKGEISNFTNHVKTGHLYFTLKDDGGLIKCVMFRNSASKLKYSLENGMKVIAHGRVSVFVRDGMYIFYAESIEPDGVGALYTAYEQLKKRLESEGLFNASRKRPVPKTPVRIGIITSPTGAAIRDMINIICRRFMTAEIILYPTLVQGNEAAEQMTEALRYFNERKERQVNVIIIGRGGGSIEDLWAFNNEDLARAVAGSQVPVISAVGHETDFTICDFAADVRAPTPSAAAELAVPDTAELKQRFGNLSLRMQTLVSQKIKLMRQNVERAGTSRALTSPKNLIDDKRMAVLSLAGQLESAMKTAYISKKNEYERAVVKLNALNPLAVISRGYSAVFGGDGRLIKSVRQVKIGDEINVKTTDGTIFGEVSGFTPDESKG